MISLDAIDRLTGGRLGTFDVACPLCGPHRHSPVNRRRKVLRVWRIESHFATFSCVRCGEHGHVAAHNGRPPGPANLARARAEAAERGRVHKAKRLSVARWLWSVRMPIAGTIAETYLRDARGYGGPLPRTLGFLPARDAYPPAMISAFGLAHEVEPGVIAITADAVRGVHLTRLAHDGIGKAGTECDKLMFGHSAGSPIVLAPPDGLLGFAVTEGIEDALSVHQATGLGAWAAGSAGRMPTLAAAVPDYIDCITVYAHTDEAGRRHAIELADALVARGFEVFMEGLE